MARTRYRFGILLFLAALCGACAARGQGAGGIEREFEFASGLVEMGFPDFAERLVDRLVRRDPGQQDRARMVRAQVMVARRRYDEAEQLLAELPPGAPQTEATRLAIANGLFRAGEVERARVLYQAFFDRYRDEPPADPDVRRFFMDAAYRFGQMMERSGDFERAIQAYDTLLRAEPEEGLARRLSVETADLMVRAAREVEGARRENYLTRARELCDKVQWGDMDLWFGRTISTMAHIEIVRGRPEEARKILQHYMDILSEIDEMLKRENLPMSFSPMAGTRFLLGTLFEEEGDRQIKAGQEPEGIAYLGRALREFFNVFAKYGESDWGAEAGTRAENLVARLQGMGRQVRVDFGAHRDRAAEAQFRLAATQFQERDYERAAAAYLRAINAFPGAGQTGRAMINLLMSYVHLGDELRTRATALYVRDRLTGDPDAALSLLAAGRHYFEQEDNEKYRWMYDRFIEGFPDHERTPAILFTLSRLAEEMDDAEGSAAYLETLTERFPGDEYYLRAVYQRAWREYEAGEYERAAERLAGYVGLSHPSQLRAQAQYLRADSYLRMREHAKAIEAFRELIGWLTPLEGTPYAGTSAELERNRELLVSASFQIGFALSRRDEPEDQVAGFRQEAVRELNAFVETFSENDLAPKAMNLIGTTQLAMGLTEEAANTFERLQQRYPESDDGRSALFALVRAAMEVGRVEVARDALTRMRDRPRDYVPEQFVGVGRIMLDGGLAEDAAQAFRLAIDSGTDDRRVVERALYGLGEASFEVGRYDDTVAALNDMIERYPRSGRLFEAQMLLGRAYREQGRFPEAVAALREVFALVNDPVVLNTAGVELARVQVRVAERAEAEGRRSEADESFRAALASYQRIAMLADPGQEALRPMLEESLLQSMELFMKVGRFDDAVAAADQYLSDFPQGAQVEAVRQQRAAARLRAAGGG